MPIKKTFYQNYYTIFLSNIIWYWQSDALTTRLDLILTRLGLSLISCVYSIRTELNLWRMYNTLYSGLCGALVSGQEPGHRHTWNLKIFENIRKPAAPPNLSFIMYPPLSPSREVGFSRNVWNFSTYTYYFKKCSSFSYLKVSQTHPFTFYETPTKIGSRKA